MKIPLLDALRSSFLSITNSLLPNPPFSNFQFTQKPEHNMAPGQLPRPTRQPNHPPFPDPTQHKGQERVHRPSSEAYQAFRLRMDMQHHFWLQRTKDHFHQLMMWAERQPSNGTVRKVERPNGEDRFAVAYGTGPDPDLRDLLEIIFINHGEVSLQHDGRDSTGKHWIKCFGKVQPGSLERPTEKAIVCVSSKLEMATIPRPRTRVVPGKGKEKATRGGNEWPPQVPGVVKGAPENLFSLPWFKQLPWLESGVAEVLREKMEAEEFEAERWEQLARRRRMG